MATTGDCGLGGGGSSTYIYQGYGITATPNPINNTGTVAVNTTTLTTFINTFGFVTSTGATINASDTQVVFMNGTTPVGSANLTYNSSTQTLTTANIGIGTGLISGGSGNLIFEVTSPNSAIAFQNQTNFSQVAFDLLNQSTLSDVTMQFPTHSALLAATGDNISEFTNNSGYITSTSINGVSSSTFYIKGTGNITSTISGASTTFSLTGVIPATNGGTATTTALGTNAFNSTAFISTSTYNASMTIATAAPLTGGASLTNGSTVSLALTTPLASTYGGTATTTAVGSAAFINIPISIANGGTGTTTAAGALSNLGGITTSTYNGNFGTMANVNSPVPIANGGTATTTAEGARSNLGAAASGANSDITSLSALTNATATGNISTASFLASTTAQVNGTSSLIGNNEFGTSTLATNSNETHWYSSSATSTFFQIGATSTATSSYKVTCFGIVPAGVASGTTMLYMDWTTAGVLQTSTSACP
jgi:hypothetical protein